MTINKLPFELSEDSTVNWLQSLSLLSSVNAADQLNKTIRQLRSTDTDANKIIRVLIQLTPTVLYLSTDIESSNQLESKQKPREKSRKIEKLCILLLRNLSLAFFTLATKKTLQEDESNQCLYIALQLIGRTQYLATIFHQFPSSTLWGKTAEIYSFAQNRNILQLEIKHKIIDFKSLPTIESVLKRNILFSVLEPYKYPDKLIKELFSISGHHAHFLGLNTKTSTDNAFSWNSNSKQPPYLSNNIQPTSNTTLGINTHELISFIQSKSFSSSLEKDALNRILLQISGYKTIINSPLPSTFDINHLIVGLAPITEYLKKTGKLNKIQKLSSQVVDNSAINEMSLEPLESQKTHTSLTSTFSSSSNPLLSEAGAEAVKILQLKNKQYIIVETKPITCSIGDITLFCASVHKPELGVIKQIKITNQSGTNHILIEKIPGVPTSQLIESPDTIENQLIIIPHQNSKAEIFIAPSKLYNGALIKLSSEENFSLDKLIDYSPYFMHYQTQNRSLAAF